MKLNLIIEPWKVRLSLGQKSQHSETFAEIMQSRIHLNVNRKNSPIQSESDDMISNHIESH